MKFTLTWLKEHLDTQATAQQIAEKLTAIGLEVESVEDKGAELQGFTVAEILEAKPHPDADKLRVCRVLTKTGERQIVCGAPNARAGIKVALADIGDTIPNGGLVIKKAKIRGVESHGMLCSARELGLGEDHAGIIELPAQAKVGESIVPALGLEDVVFDIAVTPNRGDCLGVYGIARDLAAAGMGRMAEKKDSGHPVIRSSGHPGRNIRIETPDCKAFVGRLIRGVKNGPSPEWLQKRLKSIGLRPISALVDITNYMTVTYGRPLHVYDADTLHGDIVVRASRVGEAFDALNDRHYEAPVGLCVIADEQTMLGLGGVVGGVASSCTEKTTNVFLESAWFEPEAMARTRRALGIDSDARYRFERGVDPEFLIPGAEIATRLIQEFCGGEASELVIGGEIPKTARKIMFSPADVELLGGIHISAAECKRILESLGFTVEDRKFASWETVPPSWRPDIGGKADVVEEILRIHGYDTIPETPLPAAGANHAGPDPEPRLLRRALAERGLKECYHFAFVSEKEAAPFLNGHSPVLLRNPISEDMGVMRPSLLPGLLAALSRNLARGMNDQALFEVGTVFCGVLPEQQPLAAAGARTGVGPVHWSAKPRPWDVFDVKGDALESLKILGFAGRPQIVAGAQGYYHPGKCGSIMLGKQLLSQFGEIHPAVLRAFDIDQPVMAFELWPNELPERKEKAREALRMSGYQPVRRDFAFIVEMGLAAEELLGAVRAAEKNLIRDLTLFDVYEGQGVPNGKKSLALSVTLQAPDRTLTEEELTRITAVIVDAASKRGAVLR